ncbi:unnamed protein product [Brassica rapa]|uniref:Uncharacterized protein n=1 Tax=Brassica campestris TaxID=3711 RepID=A0A3P5YW67_BRACM|nr:unnamed protein product [Brassica rapa]VDC67515.1 unnamed protein product [Brassica rapa]
MPFPDLSFADVSSAVVPEYVTEILRCCPTTELACGDQSIIDKFG